MTDIRQHIASPAPLNSPRDLRSLHSLFASREAPTMIIDDPNPNSSMPVSPKQGETITVERLPQQEPQLVSSSLTPTSWELLSSQPKSSLPPVTSSLHTSTSLSQSWTSTPTMFASSPAQMKTLKDSKAATDNFQSGKMNSDIACDSWADNTDALKSSSSSESSSPNHLLSPTRKSDETEDQEELATAAVSTTTPLIRNCDIPDSSPSPPSLLNSSYDEPDQPTAEAGVRIADRFGVGNLNLYGSLERRSRRKPTVGDIVRRIRPPVDAPPYDSEESEIEDDILHDEMMVKMSRRHHIDEVDGLTKSGMKIEADGQYGEEDARHLNVNRLSRLEAVDGIHEDDDDEEMNSESDSLTDLDKHAFLNDVPESIYNLMHEAKVNAHTMFMRTANGQSPNEAKESREQYLLQLLSNLRDKCLEEGLKPDITRAILKDVETEVTFLSEYLEDMKMKQYYPDPDKEPSFNGLDSNESHFLSKPNIKLEVDKDKIESSSHESSYSSVHPPSFFHLSSSSSPLPASSSSSPLPSSDSKPIIVTVSADIKPQPPLMYSRGGLPLHHSMASNISEHALSPLFPNGGKLGPWLPHMAMYNFSSPETFEFARKFMNLDGKVADNLDKDYLKCQFCERTFRRQKNLENHIENTHQGKGPLKPRRETGDMYFKCSHCPYTTKHQSNLYVHLRIHTGERPYICGACGVQYSQSHSLKSHIINKHDGIMSFYYKEKRTRSPRGLGYLSAQVMHDSNMFKLPGPVVGSPMHHNMDIVNKAIEMASADIKQQQQQQQNQHLSPPGADVGNHRSMMPPPLRSINGNNNNVSSSNSNNQSNNAKSSTPSPDLGSVHNNSSNTNSMFNPPGAGPHHPFFMNGHHLMFGELPPLIRNTSHIGAGHHPPHPFLPGFSHFPPNSSTNFHGATGLSPLTGLSPNSSPALSTSNSHHNLTQHLQHPGPLSRMSPSPIPLLQQQQIKREPTSIQSTPVSSKQSTKSQSDEAIDLRKKSPPLDTKEQHSHDLSTCGGKENCSHAAKLKYLRLNVVRMLGILVPNLNFAEKGISAESESVDELLQDVIESNTHEDDMME